MPLLKCLGLEEAHRALEEVHEGDCGEHLGGRALIGKILRVGVFLAYPLQKHCTKGMIM